ncbi:hypothetical protein LP419_19280 [Massilia sp. H-1]|nr:hypothetical protein LP419_19280 [Massilia sp. H-1]
MPVGAEDIARQFYSGVLGLAEIPKPAVLACVRRRLVPVRRRPAPPGRRQRLPGRKKAHPALIVNDFGAFAARLAQLGVALKTEDEVGGSGAA